MKPKIAWTFICSILLMLSLPHAANSQMREIYHDVQDDENDVLDMSFYTPNEGYVAFAKWIGYTTDSGRTYTRKYVTRTNVDFNGHLPSLTFGFMIAGVKAFSRDNLIVYGAFDYVPSILRSTDGGETFTLLYYTYWGPEHFTAGITDMVFPENGNIGYAVEFDRILKTTDGGRNWFVLRNDAGSYFDYIEAVDNNTAVAFSVYWLNKLVKITGGSSSANVAIPAGQLRYASFISADKGWINVGNDIYYTSNGGATWTKKNQVPFAVGRMRFINDNTGYAISGEHLYITTDSGKVWERLPNLRSAAASEYYLTEFLRYTPDQIWAGGEGGLMTLTTNGGGTPIPTVSFGADTTGVYATGSVKLTNYSKPNYTYQWYKNDTLIGTSYNINYTRGDFPLIDTIRLVVSNGTVSESFTSYLYFNHPAYITSFTPVSAATGATITIDGNYLLGTDAVYFGGVPAASFKVVSDTRVTAVVGSGASGNVTVRTATRGIPSLPGFNYIPPPSITSFTPTAAKAGTTITISGTGFDNASEVKFNGINAESFTVVNSNTITAVVPSGTSGMVYVKTPGGTNQLGGFLAVPDIISFTPDSGTVNTVVNITGTSLSEVNAVTIGGAPVTSFTVNSLSSITAIVGANANGDVAVTSQGGSDAMGTFVFETKPVITSMSPLSGPIGTSVTISGMYFSPVASNNIVYFGDVRATVTSASANSLTVTVPAGASAKPVSVVVNNRAAYSADVFNITFAGGGYITPNSLTKKEWGGGTGKIYGDLATGDFDGDGKTDLVIINYSGGNGFVTVARNTGTGENITFNSAVNIPLAAPKKLAVGDLDADGKLDFVVTDTLNNNFRFYRNTSTTGNISFAAPLVVSTPAAPTDIDITDFDVDGRVDVVVIAETAVTIFRNFAWSGVAFTATDFEGGKEIVVRDLNRDGKPEILYTSVYDQLMLHRNTSTPRALSVGGPSGGMIFVEGTFAPSAADLNGDHLPEVVAFYSGMKYLLAWRNATAGDNISFGHGNNYFGSGFTARATALSDLDGDGKPDLLVAQPDRNFSVYRNISEAGAHTSFELPVPFGPGNYTAFPEIDVADIDNDGKPDPIVLNEDGSAINIYINKGIPKPYIIRFSPASGTTGTVVTIHGRYFNGTTAVSFGGMAASSFTIVNDTTITAVVGAGATGDVVVTNSYGSDNAGTFVFGSSPLITSFSPASGPVGTVITIQGGNFSPNIAENLVKIGGVKANVTSATASSITAVVPAGQSVENISVTVNKLTGFSTRPFIVTFEGSLSGFSQNSFVRAYRQIGDSEEGGAVADLDNDGKPDLIYTINGHAFAVSRNNSSPGRFSFETGNHLFPGNRSVRIVSGDLDGDGLADIAALDAASNSFNVYRNTSTGTNISFAPGESYVIGQETGAGNYLVICDLDMDGRPDIIASHFNAHSVKVFKNLSTAGDINFVYDSEIEVPGQPRTIETGDVDGDMIPDVVIGVFYVWPRKGVVKNNSNSAEISFGPYYEIGSEATVEDLLISDFNNNGRAEIVTSHINPGHAIWLSEYAGTGSEWSFEFRDPVYVDGDYNKIAQGDLDGDGRMDLVVAKNLTDNFLVVKNISQGDEVLFGDTVRITDFYKPREIVLADMDLDGALDVISVDYMRTIFRNMHGPVAPVTICPGSDTSITVSVRGSQFQWQWMHPHDYFVDIADNENFAGTNTRTLSLKDIPASMDGAILQCLVDGTWQGVVYYVHVKGGANSSPQITIVENDTAVCAGTSLTFTASATNAGADPQYQWQLNGVNVGTNSNQFATGPLNANAELQVSLTAEGGCGTPTTVTDKVIIEVLPNVVPGVTAAASATEICAGEPVTFTATPANGGTAPAYEWFVNGTSVGNDNKEFTTSNITTASDIHVVMTSNAVCASPATATSAAVHVSIEASVDPSVIIQGHTDLEAGQETILLATVTNGGTNTTYQWQDSTSTHDWRDITGETSIGLQYGPEISGDKVRVKVTSTVCSGAVTVFSNALTFNVATTGGRVAPNPVGATLNIKDLKLSDQWQTLDIVNVSTGATVLTRNIANQTSVSIIVVQLPPGLYTVVLKRSSGPPTYMKFVKE